MAYRFPQSSIAVAYRIKTAYASKIKALYWAAEADKVHALKPGDTATTIITRSTSGATFNSAEGRITGTSTTLFTDSIAAGLTHNGGIVLGAGIYGEAQVSLGSRLMLLATNTTTVPYANSWRIEASGGGVAGTPPVDDSHSFNAIGFSDSVVARHDIASRHVPSGDPVNQWRLWSNGAEVTTFRRDKAVSDSTAVSSVYFGAAVYVAANTLCEWEYCFIGDGTLTDAELDAITADPSILIEEYVGSSYTPRAMLLGVG